MIGPAERERFNHFTAWGPQGSFLQSWEWGELKAATGWQPLRAVVEEGNEIKAAISILVRRLPLPGARKSIFYAPKGPIADLGDRDVLRVLVAGVRDLASRHGAILLKIDPDIEAGEQRATNNLSSFGFRPVETGDGFEGVQPRFVFRLPIADRSLDELMEAFHSKTRYNIRYAFRKGVTIRTGDRQDLPAFYQVLQETAARDDFLVRDISYYERLWDELVEAGIARVFLAEWEGKLLAGAISMKYGPTVWYVYGASSNEHRNLMPAYAVQWEMIKWAKESGCSVYDFRGVSGDLNPGNPLYGLYRFKRGFNPILTEYIGEFDLVFSPVYYWLWTTALPFYKRVKVRLRGS